MSRLETKERIDKEEKMKIGPLFLIIVIIFLTAVILNIILRVTLLIKIIAGAVLLIIVICLGGIWRKAYYQPQAPQANPKTKQANKRNH